MQRNYRHHLEFQFRCLAHRSGWEKEMLLWCNAVLSADSIIKEFSNITHEAAMLRPTCPSAVQRVRLRPHSCKPLRTLKARHHAKSSSGMSKSFGVPVVGQGAEDLVRHARSSMGDGPEIHLATNQISFEISPALLERKCISYAS